MDNDNKLKSTSERTASTIKRTLPDKDKTDCASKNLNMFRAAVLIDELCPEAVVGNLSIEQMLGVLYAEGHFSKGPPPKRREPVAILLPRPDSGKKPIVINGSVSFGRGPSCDIVLTEYGTCANISDHQATIIYDRSTGIFELLNYGRTFTMVDDYGYSNGLKLPDPMPGCPIKALIANRKKVNAGNGETIDESNVNDACQVKEGKVVNPCEQMRYMKYCSPGPAVVKHGSTLRFGCIEFIFCSLNQN